MQKWDYLILGVIESYGVNYRVNGEKVAEWKDVPLHDVFNVIGKQGFEFIQFDGQNYIFKRPSGATKSLQSLSPDKSS
jgi:hypothetical protein